MEIVFEKTLPCARLDQIQPGTVVSLETYEGKYYLVIPQEKAGKYIHVLDLNCNFALRNMSRDRKVTQVLGKVRVTG